MSVLYGTSFQYSDGEMRKNHQLMDLNPHNYYDQQQEQQQNQQNSGLLRNRSAPSSFFDSLVNGTNNGEIGGDEYHFLGPSSPEMDTILDRFMSQGNGSGDNSHSHDLQESAAIKHEVTDLDVVIQEDFPVQNLGHHNSASRGNSLYRGFGFDGLDNSKMGSGNGSNLLRQNSSPAGIVDNGFSLTGDVENYKAQNATNGEVRSLTSRLSNHVNYSSSEQRFLPQITELGDESIRSTTPVGDTRKRQYLPTFQNESWHDTSLKRVRDNDGNTFSGFKTLDNQHGSSANCVTGLIHHLSLPKTAAEMATIEKYLQFQGSVPCKIRAKRGCATHPRSIAERVRRTRISERMRKLQDLFPNLDKQTNTADMLELAVEYIKDLQNQVKTLAENKARCTCSSIRKPYSSASA